MLLMPMTNEKVSYAYAHKKKNVDCASFSHSSSFIRLLISQTIDHHKRALIAKVN